MIIRYHNFFGQQTRVTATLTYTENFFKNLEHRFLFESTKIENASFPYKPAIISEAKTNRMMSTKWTDHKEPSFASNYFIYLFFFFFENFVPV